MKSNLVELGVCSKPHGIKGGFTFRLHNTEDSVLHDGMTISLFPHSEESSLEERGENFEIESIRFGNKVICYLKGISDRNDVEAMLPFSIHVSRDVFPEPEKGEFYIDDMIGLKVYDHKSGSELGYIDGFYDNGQQVVFKIKGSTTTLEIPFVENFFPVVDLENGRIEIVKPFVVRG